MSDFLQGPLSFRAVPWRRYLLCALVLGFGGLGLSRAIASGMAVDAPEVETIAVVDGEEVSLARFNAFWEVRSQALRLQSGHVAVGVAKAQKAQIAKQLINELLLEHAAEQQQLTISEQDVETALVAWKGRISLEDYERYVAAQPQGLSDVRTQLRLELVRERLTAREVPKVFREEDLRLFYERNEWLFRPAEDPNAPQESLVVMPPFEEVRDEVARVMRQQLLDIHRERLLRTLRSQAIIQDELATRLELPSEESAALDSP